MPPPPRTPEDTFGFGSVPLSSYFRGPKAGSKDTRFSPQARGLLQQGENYRQYEMQQEADQLVNELLGQASGMSDAQINQTLLQNPQAFGSRNLGAVQNFQQFRQQVSPTPYADERLGPLFEQKLKLEEKDPRHVQNFKRRMLEENMSASDAWDAYRMDQFNEPLMQQLAEAGVDRAEFAKFRTPTGAFDPVEVSRRVAQAKAEAARHRGKNADPLDEEMSILSDALTRTDKAIEAATKADVKAALEARRLSYADRLQKATDEKLAKLRPAESAAAPSAKPSTFLSKALKISEIPVTKAP